LANKSHYIRYIFIISYLIRTGRGSPTRGALDITPGGITEWFGVSKKLKWKNHIMVKVINTNINMSTPAHPEQRERRAVNVQMHLPMLVGMTPEQQAGVLLGMDAEQKWEVFSGMTPDQRDSVLAAIDRNLLEALAAIDAKEERERAQEQRERSAAAAQERSMASKLRGVQQRPKLASQRATHPPPPGRGREDSNKTKAMYRVGNYVTGSAYSHTCVYQIIRVDVSADEPLYTVSECEFNEDIEIYMDADLPTIRVWESEVEFSKEITAFNSAATGRMQAPELEALGYSYFRRQKILELSSIFDGVSLYDTRLDMINLFERKSYKTWKCLSQEKRDEFIAKVFDEFDWLPFAAAHF
jgi:hypothetical protein